MQMQMQGPLTHGLGIFDHFGDGMMQMGGPHMNFPGGSQGSKAPPKKKEEEDDENYTTVMLRNIPNKYTRAMLIEQLHRHGFRGDIDYLYLPVDFANRCNVGYCFVSLRTPLARARFVNAFDGIAAQSCLPGFNSYKVCQVTKAKWQGRKENVRRLRSGPELMAQLAAHPEWHPLLLDEEGNEEPFELDEGIAAASAPLVPRRQRGRRQGHPGMGHGAPGDAWPLGANGLVDGMPGAMGDAGRGMGDRGGRRRRGGRGGPHMPAGFRDFGRAGGGGFGVPMAAMPVPVMTEQGVQYVPYEAAAAYGEAGSYFLAYPTMGPDQQVYGMPYSAHGAANYGGFPGGYGWPDGSEDLVRGAPPRGPPRARRHVPGHVPGLAEALAAAEAAGEEEED